MIRYLALFGAFALALSVPAGFEAEAKGKKKNKLCTATALSGKKMSFKCKAAEKCCFDWVANKGNCLPANQICL